MLSRLSTLGLFALTTLAGDASSQIRPRSNGNPTGPRAGSPVLFVATPFTTVAADSAAAVEAGVGLRERLRSTIGNNYNITTRETMNAQLANFGYPADALLDQNGVGRFASSGGASLVIYPMYQRVTPSGHRLVARLRMVGALNGGAGHVVSIEREGGEDPDDLGKRVADAMRPAFQAIAQARECFNNAANDQAKAIAAAERAVRLVPNLGAAEFCWGEILRLRDSTSTEALAHFERAVQSDPMSLATYEKMGSIYFLRSDSAKVISTYQTMLQVDPLDQALRERSFQLFSIFGRPSAAEEVADAGIERDPYNTDWYDLKSNACLMQEKYSCAIDELERLWTVDSTRADSSFFSKITYATLGGNDTTRFVKWALKGVERYPDHQDILNAANRAYGMTGDADNAIATARKLLVINPYDPAPVNRTVVLLGNAGQAERIVEFLPVVVDAQDEELSNNFAGILVTAASQVAGTDLAKADSLSRVALAASPTNPTLVAYANYFSAAHTFGQVTTLSSSVRQSRNCAEARQYQTVLEGLKPKLEAAGLSADERIKSFSTQALGVVNQELGVMPEMIGAFCR
jgi:tetratricopeptide (TPR) repeat protein